MILLAEYAQEKTHVAWPSQATLARDLGISLQSVRRALAVLDTYKVIKRTMRTNEAGGRTSDRIKLHVGREFCITRDQARVVRLDREVKKPVVDAAPPMSPRDRGYVPVGQGVCPHGTLNHHRTSIEPPLRPSQEGELTFQEEAPRTREDGQGRPTLTVVPGGLSSSGWAPDASGTTAMIGVCA
nr:helix-turn-helix domain-containing protein [Chelatococcus sp. YT9]